MEHIIFRLISLLSRLTTSLNSLITSVAGAFARWFSHVASLVEAAIGMVLWCVPPVIWTIVIRFVVKHR
jgi:hypothetical protein